MLHRKREKEMGVRSAKKGAFPPVIFTFSELSRLAISEFFLRLHIAGSEKRVNARLECCEKCDHGILAN